MLYCPSFVVNLEKHLIVSKIIVVNYISLWLTLKLDFTDLLFISI